MIYPSPFLFIASCQKTSWNFNTSPTYWKNVEIGHETAYSRIYNHWTPSFYCLLAEPPSTFRRTSIDLSPNLHRPFTVSPSTFRRISIDLSPNLRLVFNRLLHNRLPIFIKLLITNLLLSFRQPPTRIAYLRPMTGLLANSWFSETFLLIIFWIAHDRAIGWGRPRRLTTHFSQDRSHARLHTLVHPSAWHILGSKPNLVIGGLIK